MSNDTDMKLLTTAEFAGQCRVSESTARYWRATGFGPRGFRLGKRVLYRSGEVEAWLLQRESEGGAS